MLFWNVQIITNNAHNGHALFPCEFRDADATREFDLNSTFRDTSGLALLISVWLKKILQEMSLNINCNLH